MSLKYIRDYYNVPAYRGARIKVSEQGGSYAGEEGAIMSGTHYLAVRLDKLPHSRLLYHPLDLEYLS